MFRITVTEMESRVEPGETSPASIVRYEQVVDNLNLPAVFAAVNAKPRKPRERKNKETTA